MKAATRPGHPTKRTPRPDRAYPEFLTALHDTFAAYTMQAPALFRVSTEGLWDAYIFTVPNPAEHDCRACRTFVERYGGLVTVADDGALISALWDPFPVPDAYRDMAAALGEMVERRPIVSAFRASSSVLGVPVTGAWTHASVPVHAKHRQPSGVALDAEQWAAGIAENVETVDRALGEFSAGVVVAALGIVEAGAVDRAERFTEPLRWLLGLHHAREAIRTPWKFRHVLWNAVAFAPEGFAHVRSSMTGALLADVASGRPMHETVRAFNAKVAPLAYQRPTAPPAAGTIDAAERTVAALGLAPAFARRWARLSDCEPAWTPPPATAPGVPDAGMFAHLRNVPTQSPTVDLGPLPQPMTWAVFARDVLPSALRIDAYVPHGPSAFIALTTADDAVAPPIIAWDRLERRNPVAWYVPIPMSVPSRWNLPAGVWLPVDAVVPLPNLWGPTPAPQHGQGVVLALRGAADVSRSASRLFPEHMRGDLHGLRSVVEAHSKADTMRGESAGGVAGFDLRAGNFHAVTVRVTSAATVRTVRLDRWE